MSLEADEVEEEKAVDDDVEEEEEDEDVPDLDLTWTGMSSAKTSLPL